MLASALALSWLLSTSHALSAPGPMMSPARGTGGVTLAEATSRVDRGATKIGDVVPLLREQATLAIASIDWSPLRLTRRYGLSATVVRLETKRTGDRTLESACVVSAAVRELDTGNLLFVVEGRARVEDAATGGARAERDALETAVRGAVRAVPDGLRRSM